MSTRLPLLNVVGKVGGGGGEGGREAEPERIAENQKER